jgi:hypothetical protein
MCPIGMDLCVLATASPKPENSKAHQLSKCAEEWAVLEGSGTVSSYCVAGQMR